VKFVAKTKLRKRTATKIGHKSVSERLLNNLVRNMWTRYGWVKTMKSTEEGQEQKLNL